MVAYEAVTANDEVKVKLELIDWLAHDAVEAKIDLDAHDAEVAYTDEDANEPDVDQNDSLAQDDDMAVELAPTGAHDAETAWKALTALEAVNE